MTTKLKNLSGEQLRHLRRDWTDKGGYRAVDSGTLPPYHDYIEMVTHFSDGSEIVLNDQGLIVTAPITEPSTPLERFDTDAGGSCCTECFAVSDDDYNGNAYPSMCVEPDCDCHAMPVNNLLEKEYDPTWNGFKKDVTPTDVQGVILSAIGVLLLIAIGAAAGVK